MKKMFAGLVLVAVTSASIPTASAGDREWATAGKILTGLVAAQVISQAIAPPPPPPPVYVTPAPVYVAPAPVYVAPPPPPAPVYVAPAPVYYAPPVYCAPPVYYAPRPVVSLHFGFGGHYHGHRHGHWR